MQALTYANSNGGDFLIGYGYEWSRWSVRGVVLSVNCMIALVTFQGVIEWPNV